MGRRGVSVDDDARWVFNRLASVYHHRPAYPPALINRLVALAGEGGAVADLGAGTGHLAVPLASRGLEVVAVEPAARMLAALKERAAGAGVAVRAVHAAGEDTGLPASAFDLVVIADALHWLDAERAGAEVVRLVPAGGRVAVIELDLVSTPFSDAVAEAARALNPRAFPRSSGIRDRRVHFLATARVHRPTEETFDDRTRVPVEQIPGLLASMSFVGPALGPEGLAQVVARATEAATRAGEAVWARTVTVTSGRVF